MDRWVRRASRVFGIVPPFVGLAFSSCSEDASPNFGGSESTGGAAAAGGLSGTAGQGSLGGAPGHGGSAGSGAAGSGGSSNGPGGQAGVGGSGGGILNWFLSNEWTAVPELDFTGPEEACYLAEPSNIQFPALEWQTCGNGCAEADFVQGVSTGYSVTISTVTDGSGNARPVLYGSHLLDVNNTQIDVFRSVNLDDGITTSVLGCRKLIPASDVSIQSAAITESARSAVIAKSTSTSGKYLRGMPPLDRQHGWVWASPYQDDSQIPPVLSGFDLDVNGGQVFGLGAGSVFAQLDPTHSGWTTIEKPSTAIRGAGQGDLAVWFDYLVEGGVRKERIRPWNQGGGLQTLVDSMPGEFQTGLDVSPTRIVGAVRDVYEETAQNQHIHFWQTPRAYNASQVALTQTPDIPLPRLQIADYLVRSWGKYAATLVNQMYASEINTIESTFVVLADLDTGMFWRISPTPDHGFLGLSMTITDKQFFIAEGYKNDSQFISSILRIDLDKLDTAATAL